MATLGTTQKLFRHYEIKLFQESNPEPGSIALAKDLATTSTSIFRAYATYEGLGVLIKSIDKASRLKDFATSAMFSVTGLGVNLGFDYLRTKEIGANATYALSVKVQNTDWMDFDAVTAANSTRRTLERPVSVIEEEEVSDPIYLDLYDTDYDAIYDGVLVLEGEKEAAKEQFVYPQNLTLESLEIVNLFDESTKLNISYNTDVTPESKRRFQRLVTNREIEKGSNYSINVAL